MSAQLFVVATPIGHLDDMTYRAIEVQKSVKIIAAEDTRTSAQLLKHFNIQTPLTACHDHNESNKIDILIQRLLKGEDMALISDAGTPLISDPGFKLVRAAQEHNIRVIPVPGACAAIAALSSVGLPSDRFSFEGFLSSKQTQRLASLEKLKDETQTLIFYEAPHRIMKTLNMMLGVFGDRDISISREITKKFETIYRGKLSDVIKNIPEKGEFVIVVSGCDEKVIDDNLSINEAVDLYIKAGLDVMTAIKKVAKDRKIPKNEVYKEYHKEGK